MTRSITKTEVICRSPDELRAAIKKWADEVREPVGLNVDFAENNVATITFRQIELSPE